MARPPSDLPPRSGRRVVAALAAVVVLGWFGLDRAFRAWSARYQARAAYGAARVAPVVDALAPLAPPDVAPLAWGAAVRDTHAMLVALAGAGLLDEGQMADLRRRLLDQVGAATRDPATARATLAQIWDDLERDAGPVIAPDRVPPPPGSRHARRHPRPPRPAILGPPRPSPRPDSAPRG